MQALLIPRVNFADPAKCFYEGEEKKVLFKVEAALGFEKAESPLRASDNFSHEFLLQ